MFDFNKYNDAIEVKRFEGFIDRNGYFYKVVERGKNKNSDSHNKWAEQYLKEKINIKKFKFNPTASALLTLASLNGPAQILVDCFGFVYYSHDPDYFKPIIKVPNPKVSNYKVTEEQLNFLFLIMTANNENTNIPIFFNDEDEFDYSGVDEYRGKRI